MLMSWFEQKISFKFLFKKIWKKIVLCILVYDIFGFFDNLDHFGTCSHSHKNAHKSLIKKYFHNFKKGIESPEHRLQDGRPL